MLLTIDIGNTNITLGLFENDVFQQEFRLLSNKEISQDEYKGILKSVLNNFVIDGCIIASVVDGLGSIIKEAIDSLYNINSLEVTNKIKLGIKIAADIPAEVGADRIANAAAAANLYNSAVIVIDFGTATTFDIINSKKEFCGGIIAPGVKTQLKSLYSSTSKLPEIEPDNSAKALATNTKEAILAGVIRGSACMADGLIEQCENELGEKTSIVLTGGYSSLIALYMKHHAHSKPILTLEGLKDIYYLNRK